MQGFKRLPTRLFTAVAFVAALAIALPASATVINVPLQNVHGSLHYGSHGVSDTHGSTTKTRDFFIKNAHFTNPGVNPADFNALLNAGNPVTIDFTLTGKVGNYSETLQISRVFTDPTDLNGFANGQFMDFGKGQVSGDLATADVSDVVARVHGFQVNSGQIVGGIFDLGGNIDVPVGTNHFPFSGLTGSFNISTKVNQVPEPGSLGILGLGLCALLAGLFLRQRRRD